jgi:ABC-type antimicrobial peptide transport system permease subunit
MIADSRRETAVFRAIGAKKLDIAQIYVLYTVFLSALVTLFAVGVGTLVAMVVQLKWADPITLHALLAYNSHDLDKVFRLYHFHLPDMLYLLAVAVGAGILSAVFPLIRNLRRNPMRDMRDDT